MEETLEVELTTKRVERLTERIGAQRVALRDAEVADWEALPLMARLSPPSGIKAPSAVCATCDAGRAQRCDLSEGSKTNWCATNVGALMELELNVQDADPCPSVPDKFLNLGAVDGLTREIKRSTPKGMVFQKSAAEDCQADVTSPETLPLSPAVVALSPKIVSRDVLATFADCPSFGKMLAAAAWKLGFASANLKAFVADGQSSNWSIWEQHFKHLKFVPILDFIHALTYVYSAAMAGRSREDGWKIYVRWITWVWQGLVPQVIEELTLRIQELGMPSEGASESDPREIVATALTYLSNQQSRMRYPDYRRQGLPITSSPIESTVKQINDRVKGSEKFWTRSGGEAVLQLRADQISDTGPLDLFWAGRARTATGTRRYASAA